MHNKKRVALYGRVSTEHEAQIYALENQISYYEDILSKNSSWVLVERYIDEGITGVKAKKRPQFQKMIADAKDNVFDLIITREVSRFARNTVDTLNYTRELKRHGIEVYFIADNISTSDKDGELRLSIMATLAQEESRKISERVKAGQESSRKKGVLYGTGNILGYNRPKGSKSYIINEEQAETVRMIFDLYEEGLGMMQIRYELEKSGRKDAFGKVAWSQSKVDRILNRTTYCGIMTYNQNQIKDFLEGRRETNYGEKMYAEGVCEPIISISQFENCAKIRKSRSIKIVANNGKIKNRGKKKASVWQDIIQCNCGSSFRRDVWRVNAKEERNYGFRCYNQINNGSKARRIELNMDVVNICEQKSVAEWKLYLVATKVASIVWGNSKDVISRIIATVDCNYTADSGVLDKEIKSYENNLELVNRQIKNLISMRSNEEISKEEFLEMRQEYDIKLTLINSKIKAKKIDISEILSMEEMKKNINEFLKRKVDFEKDLLDDVLTKLLFERIIIANDIFKCYINIADNKIAYHERILIDKVIIGLEEAKVFKQRLNTYIRMRDWNGIIVEIYL